MTEEEKQKWIEEQFLEYTGQILELSLENKKLKERIKELESQINVFRPFDSVDEVKVERILKLIK